MTDHKPERHTIREAKTRLLEGRPIRSDGKLTVKSLAEEASVKRWILTHRHQDLQAEFRDRVATHGTDPEPVRALKNTIEGLTKKSLRPQEQLRQLKASTAMLERHIAVDALETTHFPIGANPMPTRLHPAPAPVQPAEEPRPEPRGRIGPCA